MSTTVVLPAAFPLVGLGLASTYVLTLFQGSKVMTYRKGANVNYPNMYASEEVAAKNPAAFKLNCAQRAHQNTLENVAQIMVLTVYLGLFNPKAALAYNLLWVAGRVLYTSNYINNGPACRNDGKFIFCPPKEMIKLTILGVAKIAYIGLFGLFFSTIYYSAVFSYKLLA